MKNLHCSGFVFAVILMFCNGCISKGPISYVTPGEPVALVEFVLKKSQPMESRVVPRLRVDGRWALQFKHRGYDGHAFAVELPPGRHVLDARITRSKSGAREGDTTFVENQPLTIELEARAGHNYRLCGYAYDPKTVSFYIEDIDTGEVVSGHRPEKAITP